jgi:AcrR family transcriptional regulator
MPRYSRKTPHVAHDTSSLTPADWIAAARAALIAGGLERVKVDVLARELNISRGSFYWHFASRDALLDALLRDWRTRNTAPFEAAMTRADRDGLKEFQAIVDMWLEEKDYDPAYDSAVREWARTSSKVANLVRQVDRERIALLAEIFRDLGFPDLEADIRARVAYFHQVGYYTLGLKESKELRRKLAPMYRRVLLGR